MSVYPTPSQKLAWSSRDIVESALMSMPCDKCDKCNGTGLMNDPRATGQILRKEREQAGMSLRAMAGKLEVSAAYLSDLERGRRNWSEDRIAEYRRMVMGEWPEDQEKKARYMYEDGQYPSYASALLAAQEQSSKERGDLPGQESIEPGGPPY